MSATLDTIVALQRTLTELANADRRLNSIPDWMQELHEEHSQRQAEIDAVANTQAEAEKAHREAEAELGDAQEKLQHYQQQISRVSTQREYGALLKEIDTVKEQIRTAEQRALEAMEEAERAKKELAELQESFQDLDQRYQAELSKWEGEKPSVADALERLTARSEELRAEVPRPKLTLFDRLFKRYDGQALARVRKTVSARGDTMWHCEACSFNVRPQTVVEIRNGDDLTMCDSCKRILFWEEEEGDEG
jgi:hypothetical protein